MNESRALLVLNEKCQAFEKASGLPQESAGHLSYKGPNRLRISTRSRRFGMNESRALLALNEKCQAFEKASGLPQEGAGHLSYKKAERAS